VVSATNFRAGNLRFFAAQWTLFGAPQTIVKLVSACPLQFVSKPPLRIPSLRAPAPSLLVRQQINVFLQMDAVEAVPISPSFISPLFVVPQPDKDRLIFNLKALNKYLDPPHFSLPNIQSMRDLLRPDSFITTLDLHKAYLQVPIDPRFFPFLRFVLDGKLYQFKVLPFGLSTAPHDFQMITWLVSWLRRHGLRSLVYLDDIISSHSSKALGLSQVQTQLTFFHHLGVVVSPKSKLVPSHRAKVLGLIYDTVLNTISLPPDKIESLRRLIKVYLFSKRWTLWDCQHLTGKLNFASQVIPLGMLHLRQAHRQIRPLRRSSRLLIPPVVQSDLRWWIRHLTDSVPIFRPPPTVFFATDASDYGWAAVVNGKHLKGCWTARQRRWSINRRELYVVLLAINHWSKQWDHQTILLQTDNSTVVAVLNNQGTTKSLILLALASRILVLAHQLHITLLVYHLPGRFLLLPDALSRPGHHRPEWHLRPTAAQALWSTFGPPTIDLFASNQSHQVQHYVSFNVTDNQAVWIDAFSRPWKVKVAWLFPPPTLIPQVLRHLQSATGRFYLLAPHWESAWWIHELQVLAAAPIPVPNLDRNLIDLDTGLPPPQVDRISLMLWPISLVGGTN